MEVALFFVVLDLMVVSFGILEGDADSFYRTTYSDFVGIDTDSESIRVNETYFKETVNLTPIKEVNAIIGFISSGVDWVGRVVGLLAWFAGSMILVPITVLHKLEAPFVVQVIVGVPAVILQAIIIISVISGRVLHK